MTRTLIYLRLHRGIHAEQFTFRHSVGGRTMDPVTIKLKIQIHVHKTARTIKLSWRTLRYRHEHAYSSLTIDTQTENLGRGHRGRCKHGAGLIHGKNRAVADVICPFLFHFLFTQPDSPPAPLKKKKKCGKDHASFACLLLLFFCLNLFCFSLVPIQHDDAHNVSKCHEFRLTQPVAIISLHLPAEITRPYKLRKES